jgi:hypothetical protein
MTHEKVSYIFTSHSSVLHDIEMASNPWRMVLSCSRDNRYLRVAGQYRITENDTCMLMSNYSVRIIGRSMVNYYAFANGHIYLSDEPCTGPFERSNNFSIRYLVESLCLTAKNIKYGKR